MKRKIIKGIIIFFAFCLQIVYLLPYFANHILNIGSVFGIAFGGLIIVCAVFSRQLLDLIKKICSSKAVKGFFISFVALVSAFLLLFAGTFLYVLVGAKTTATDEETVIVLGCLVKGDVPSAQLRWRINAAEKYLNEHPEAVAILSGGQGERENVSEAQCMFSEMVKDGIDPSRLYKEEKSTDTRENILFSVDIIKEKGLSDSVAIVSNNYHVARAKLIARKSGLDAAGISAYSDPTPVFFTREVFGIWWTLLGLYN